MRHGTVDDKRVSHDSPVMVDQLDLLVGPVVGEAVVDEDVEPVPLAAHVDGESYGVAHVDRTVDAVAGKTVAGADLHEALGRGEGEDHRVRRVGSTEQGGGTDMAGTARRRKDEQRRKRRRMHFTSLASALAKAPSTIVVSW